jgi:predicted nucleotide-binding protein (sugar kinase/HSP70/actin superfamily)
VKNKGNNSVQGKTVFIHPMSRSGARLIAASFRSVGIDAKVLAPSDARTLEIGSMYSAGDECLPQKITFGDYLKVADEEGFDPTKTAFLMPTATGPCRFGQYWPLLKKVLHKRGLDEIQIINPNSEKGYGNISENGYQVYRLAWLGVLCSDIIKKMLLMTRPYELVKGSADTVYENALSHLEAIIGENGVSLRKHRTMIRDELIHWRNEFRNIPADYVKGKPLIGVVGEIFCRHNRFANENMVKKLVEHGVEPWLADISEWVFYTDWSRIDNLRRFGKQYSPAMAFVRIKRHIMRWDEEMLFEPFHSDFIGYEEPESTDTIVQYGEPYLPARGALGEMALSLGRSGYLYHKGVDGIVDISPFSCMNGIVSEAVYPSFSKDHNDLPCRVFYYDGMNLNVDRDIEIFIELVKGYMRRKTVERVYPERFNR